MDTDGWLPGDLAARGVSYMTAELYWEDTEQKQKKLKNSTFFYSVNQSNHRVLELMLLENLRD